jgi:transposase-like protein
VNHFGPMIAADLRKRRPKPHATWHLDEVYLRIGGRVVYLWRAVDAEGEVLDVLVQSKRNKHEALKLMRKLLKKYGFAPDRMITDDLRSYDEIDPPYVDVIVRRFEAESGRQAIFGPTGETFRRKKREISRRFARFRAAATASRHVLIAAARKARCVRADVRWRWTLKIL